MICHPDRVQDEMKPPNEAMSGPNQERPSRERHGSADSDISDAGSSNQQRDRPSSVTRTADPTEQAQSPELFNSESVEEVSLQHQ